MWWGWWGAVASEGRGCVCGIIWGASGAVGVVGGRGVGAAAVGGWIGWCRDGPGAVVRWGDVRWVSGECLRWGGGGAAPPGGGFNPPRRGAERSSDFGGCQIRKRFPWGGDTSGLAP